METTTLCPCGKPATRKKYCSRQCAEYFCRKSWMARNKEKVKGYRKAWCQRNPDYVKAQHEAWLIKNREHHLACRRARHKKNRDKIREARKRYYEKNKKKKLARDKEYYQSHKETKRASHKKWQQDNREHCNRLNRAAYKNGRRRKLEMEFCLMSMAVKQLSPTCAKPRPSKPQPS